MDQPNETEILGRCAAVLGAFEVVADRSWPRGVSRVLEIRTDRGPVIAKWMSDRPTYRRELRAYQHFVPALGNRAPALLHHADDLCLLVLTRLPGKAPNPSDIANPEIHRQAGTLLRRLHDSAPRRYDPGYIARLLRRFDKYAVRAMAAPFSIDIDRARHIVQRAGDIPQQPLVPTMYDAGPRNWLIDHSTLRLIDFGLTDWNPWCLDLVKLQRGPWLEHDDLQAAFLDGYGKSVDRRHADILPALHVVSAIFSIAMGHEFGNAALQQGGRTALIDAMRAAEK